jgi:hypothetical protein
MDIAGLAEKRFYHEVERRRDLQGSLSIPLGILTVLFAGLVAMLASIRTPLNVGEWIILVACIPAAGCGLACCYFMFRAYLGYIYKHLPLMEELKNWRDGIVVSGYSEAQADARLKAEMIDRYITAADHNCINNDRKAVFQHKAGVSLTIFLMLAVVAGVPYVWLQFSEDNSLKSSQIQCTIACPLGGAIHERPVTPTSASASPNSAGAAIEGHSRE